MNDAEFSLEDGLLDELEGELQDANPDKDILAALLFDTSGSMGTSTTDGSGVTRAKSKGAEAGFQSLIDYCQSVPFLKRSVQLGVGWFGQSVGFNPFSRVDAVTKPNFRPGGGTPLGPALKLALDAIQDLVIRLDDEERRFSIPNLCIVSDGVPARCSEFTASVARAAKLVKSGDLSISLVGIDQTDCDCLKSLGLSGKAHCVSEVSWEEIIKQATLGGGGTSSQQDAA